MEQKVAGKTFFAKYHAHFVHRQRRVSQDWPQSTLCTYTLMLVLLQGAYWGSMVKSFNFHSPAESWPMVAINAGFHEVSRADRLMTYWYIWLSS